jgi:hypothetical protein
MNQTQADQGYGAAYPIIKCTSVSATDWWLTSIYIV